MSEARVTFSTTCPDCGHELPPGTQVCPGCGKAFQSAEADLDPWSQWSRAGKTLRTQWVAAVVAFWVSAAVLGVVFFIEHKLNLILVSIVLGMLLIGVWLKTRYQLHQRKKPSRQSENVRAD
ncbi:MAG: zinc ribbon domain-containing protein [Pseudomonadota bacterium]|nr:zinc ribbon domain-containing protein [Pseudomonadota bacterium]